ncbi:phosphinothricin acetyltransferase [Lentibacillus halodurans]|uniref:Phosphinothricin acetyltransferase n=1 Tax=Lentibacillus halodurans TaxID=237679 RepID=A0A1I0Y2T8_9BACI|nr:GNAT family N-acetyltransferase [Lentibacillus halodurans]SFB06930.1 phosphinothricin acetyltransferase [Lentibacillus halodurans]
MNSQIVIDRMKKTDWNQVRNIFIEGIHTGNATFETGAPTWEEWDREHFSVCRLVARKGEDVVGWAALTPISKREAHAGAAEVSIYISGSSTGNGVGTKLLQVMVNASEDHDFWSLEANIFPENKSSISLHKKCGFTEVGVRHRLGKLNGVWRDVVILERRSAIIGVD